jgi:hypothetical protein
LSNEFRYTSSHRTDLHATFRRIKREQARERAAMAMKVTKLPIAKRS